MDSHENVSRNVNKTLLMSMENCETVTSQIDLLNGKQVQPLFPYHDLEKKMQNLIPKKCIMNALMNSKHL